MLDSFQIIKLDEILNDEPSLVVERIKRRFVDINTTFNESYILFGAGSLGKIALAHLRQIGIVPLCFVDNNPNLWGKKLDGLNIFSPIEAANEFREKAIFIITIYTNEPIIRQLKSLDVKFMTFASLAWYYSDIMFPHGALDWPHQIFYQADMVRKAFGLWNDDISREEYLWQLKWRTSLQSDNMPKHLSPNEIYFPFDLMKLSEYESFVDCGAFDGDSVETFLRLCKNKFRSILAIEPDPENYLHLRKRIDSYTNEIRQNVKATQAALGSINQQITFSATGTAGSSIGEGSYEVNCIPLDNILKSEIPTYIKMDIEGAEIDALIGAKQTIKKFLPILAVCVYHKQDHLWKIPLMIQSISDDYEFFLRRYSDECWELVCYAIPKERIIVNHQGHENVIN